MNLEAPSAKPRGVLFRRVALVILCAAGLVLCGLLMQASGGEGAELLNKICAPSARVNCASVLASGWSKIGGISASLLGFVYFGALLVWFAGVGIPNRVGRLWHLVPVLSSTLGLLFSAYFVWVMATQLSVWCTLCVGVHVANAFIWLICVISWPKGAGEVAYPSATRAGIVLGATGAAVVILALGVWSVQLQIAARKFQSEFIQVVNDPAYVEWKLMQQPVQEIPIGPDDLVLGKPDARNTIVVFSDFECANCRLFDQFAQRMVNLGVDVRVVFKNFPMSSQCNPHVKETFHLRACDAALAAEAGAMATSDQSVSQGIREFLFAKLDQVFPGRNEFKLAFGSNVTWSTVLKNMDSKEAASRLASDIELGHKLGVEGTPAIFLNGRRMKTSWQLVTNDIHPTLDLKATDALWRRLLAPRGSKE